MRQYDIRLLTAAGREQSRTVEAESEQAAALAVLASGATPLQIRLRGSGWLERLNAPLRRADAIGLADLALFAEQLAEMLRAGVTLEQALTLLSRDASRNQLGALAARLLRQVRAGSALSQALAGERAIPPFFAGLVRGAERGGTLGEGLHYLGDYLGRQAATRSKIIATLTYPAIVVVTALFALAFVLTVVIPEFAPLFAGEESKLPLVTRLVLWMSELVTTRLPLIVALALGAPAAVALLARRVAPVRQLLGRLAMRLPPVALALRLDVAKTMRVLGALLASGVEVSEALTLAQAAAGAPALRRGLQQAARLVREGSSFSAALEAIAVVPESLTTLLAVGERTGELGAATLRAATVLELETGRRVDRLIAVLNPIAVVVLGALIALLISGVMLGILSANQFALR
ncbi:MAG: type II secretion system F family protein [Pseudomonadota bacterium]